MGTKEILKEITRLPVSKRRMIVEETLQSIHAEENSENLKKAAHLLYEDYKNDKELTAFTEIDFEDFYEAR